MSTPTVLGWRSPWSGDERDPIPRRYWAWYRAYRLSRRLMHRVGLHDWRRRPLGDDHCDWCGTSRGC